MRLLGVILVWAAILCALGVFLMGRDRPAQTATPSAEESKSEQAAFDATGYVLEITPTFMPVPDPFALPDDPLASSGLVLSKNGRILYRYENEALQDRAILLDPAPGLEAGLVEYLVEASPRRSAHDAPQSRAVRVRLLHHGAALAGATFWSEPGGLIRGVLRVDIKTSEEASHGG